MDKVQKHNTCLSTTPAHSHTYPLVCDSYHQPEHSLWGSSVLHEHKIFIFWSRNCNLHAYFRSLCSTASYGSENINYTALLGYKIYLYCFSILLHWGIIFTNNLEETALSREFLPIGLLIATSQISLPYIHSFIHNPVAPFGSQGMRERLRFTSVY
jgi:hypothetical protein